MMSSDRESVLSTSVDVSQSYDGVWANWSMRDQVAAGVVPAGCGCMQRAWYQAVLPNLKMLQVLPILRTLLWFIMDLSLQIKHLLQNEEEESHYSSSSGRHNTTLQPYPSVVMEGPSFVYSSSRA